MSEKGNYRSGGEEGERAPVVRLRIADLFSALSLAVAIAVVGLSVLRDRRDDWRSEIRLVETRLGAEVGRLWTAVDRLRERK